MTIPQKIKYMKLLINKLYRQKINVSFQCMHQKFISTIIFLVFKQFLHSLIFINRKIVELNFHHVQGNFYEVICLFTNVCRIIITNYYFYVLCVHGKYNILF